MVEVKKMSKTRIVVNLNLCSLKYSDLTIENTESILYMDRFLQKSH